MKYEQHKQYPTEPGWYCIGMDREDSEEQTQFGPDFGPIYYFDGADWWTDEHPQYGEEKTSLWDPILQAPMGMDCADYYVKQS